MIDSLQVGQLMSVEDIRSLGGVVRHEALSVSDVECKEFQGCWSSIRGGGCYIRGNFVLLAQDETDIVLNRLPFTMELNGAGLYANNPLFEAIRDGKSVVLFRVYLR